MATAGSLISEDQLQCSICLDVFTEPVSTPCGHNFCKDCITKHWEGKDRCLCPLCNDIFSKGLKLRVNTRFREVVENFRQQQRTDDDSQVKPGQVPCDCCPANKSEASKTCLVCLTSFCETHLEPHRRVVALRNHKLINPVHDLEDKICQKHNKIFELFCRNDLTRVCVLCAEHSAHDTVPLEEAYVEAQPGTAEAQVVKINKRRKKAKKTKETVQARSHGRNETDRVEQSDVEYLYIWIPNEDPHQLNTYLYLPENMGVAKGKIFYEVETKGKTHCILGIVRHSIILHKKKFTFNPRNGNWFIVLNKTECMAMQNVPVQFFLKRSPERVFVFVDYDNGLVSFYDADTGDQIYTFTGCKFKDTICLFYDVRCAQRSENNFRSILALILTLLVMIYACFTGA